MGDVEITTNPLL